MGPEQHVQVQGVRLHHAQKTISAKRCLSFGPLHHGGRAWVIADKNYTLSMLTGLKVISASHCGFEYFDFDFMLVPTDPLEVVSSTDWFADLHQDILNHGGVSAAWYSNIFTFDVEGAELQAIENQRTDLALC